jgi:hypothetical protein
MEFGIRFLHEWTAGNEVLRSVNLGGIRFLGESVANG